MCQEESPNLLISDCQSIVDTWGKGFVWATSARRPRGGIWRSAYKHGAAVKVSGVEKVKAHQDFDSMEPGEDKFRAEGNRNADFYANLGTGLHGHTSVGLKALAGGCDATVKWLHELGRRLSAWPRAHELFGKFGACRILGLDGGSSFEPRGWVR